MKSLHAVILFILLKRTFAQSDTIQNETTKPESIKIYEDTAKRLKPSRRNREYGMLPQGVLSNSSLTYYEPYWKGGEHVYLHTTKKPEPWPTSINYFKPFSGPTDKPTPAYSGREPDRYRDCYRDCPRIYYYNYGRVCGFRFSTSYKEWENKFKEFENMCALEQENCKTPGKAKMNTYYYHYIKQNIILAFFVVIILLVDWQAWHRGACRETLKFPENPTDAPGVKNRANQWQKDLDDPQLHPFYEIRYQRKKKRPS